MAGLIDGLKKLLGRPAESAAVPAAVPGGAVFRPLVDSRSWTEARSQPLAFVYKHSPTCAASSQARMQVVRFAGTHEHIPVYEVDVRAARDLSQRIATELAIPHESPQIILLVAGQPRWHESHWGIKIGTLEAALSDAG